MHHYVTGTDSKALSSLERITGNLLYGRVSMVIAYRMLSPKGVQCIVYGIIPACQCSDHYTYVTYHSVRGNPYSRTPCLRH